MSKVNLIESHFDLGHPPFEAAVLCTYTLDLNFLENYLLQLRGLGSCESIGLFVDGAIYDEFIGRRYTPRWLNRRYLVTPIRSSGVFHTKLYILASARRAVVTVGSANLTREGIAGNLELLSTFTVSEKSNEFAPVLGDALGYVQRLAERSGSEEAARQISDLMTICGPLLGAERPVNEVQFVHNLDRPLLDTILDSADGLTVRRVHILSPFFDNALAPMERIQQRLPGVDVTVSLQQGKSNFPAQLLEMAPNSVSAAVFHDIERYVHGKAIIFEADDEALVYSGSANFTRSALLGTAGSHNYEIGLVGRVSVETALSLIQPNGAMAVPVTSAAEVKTAAEEEPKPPRQGWYDCLAEAVMEGSDKIRLRLKPTVGPAQFNPRRFLLEDSNGSQIEGDCPSDLMVKLDRSRRSKLADLFTVQLHGTDGSGARLVSNRVWAISLQERSGNAVQRALRRIIHDPSQLREILQELSTADDERELMMFLSQFDIPLNLILPLRNSGRGRIASRGNLLGALPFRKNGYFSSDMLRAYDDCLHRLLSQMRKHAADLHRKQESKDKSDSVLSHGQVGNFALIYISLLSVLAHVSEWATRRYEDITVISTDDWAIIRDYYDMILGYTSKSWEIVWSKDGFRNGANALLAVQTDGEEPDETQRFEDWLILHFGDTSEELVSFMAQPLQDFAALHSRLKFRNPKGLLISPKIFATNHDYLQEDRRETQDRRFEQTRKMLSSLATPS